MSLESKICCHRRESRQLTRNTVPGQVMLSLDILAIIFPAGEWKGGDVLQGRIDCIRSSTAAGQFTSKVNST